MIFLRIAAAILFGAAILWLGITALRAAAGDSGKKERVGPEDVEGLDVFLVCKECGTEYQVTKLGEIQIPRHCGEPMQVVRRPRPVPGPGVQAE